MNDTYDNKWQWHEDFQSPKTIGEAIGTLRNLREQLSQANAVVKDLKDKETELCAEIQVLLDEQGTTRVSDGVSTLSLTYTDVPTVTDWDAVYDYIREHDAFYLLERRMSAAPFRELLGQGQQVPGTEVFSKPKISLRRS